MPITVEEIAKLAGVSRATVSRVVNHRPNVRPEVRERVQQVIALHHYQPNRAAQSLATRQAHAIGLIVPNSFPLLFNDIFFPRLIQGIAEVCNTHDYIVTVALTTSSSITSSSTASSTALVAEPERQVAQFERILSSGAIDGMIVANASLDDPLFPLLRDSRLPFVLVGRGPASADLSYVDVDNLLGGRLITEYLIGLGHRRIGIVGGPLERAAGQDRLQGYQQALDAAGIPFDHALTACGDFTEASGYAAALRLLPARPTAIFACSDLMALGVLRAAADAGLSVPDDLSVAGFDNFLAATATQPPLTTVAQPVIELGRAAAELLLELIHTREAPRARQCILPVELVVRQSTRTLASTLAPEPA